MTEFTHKYAPKTIDDILGQEHLLLADAPLRQLIDKEHVPHAFFYGPPGVGKTTIARLIAKALDRPFYEFNATTLKIADLRSRVDGYANALQKPLIFIDEVHRLSKNQQEVLLPYMEKNSALFFGASTQNPYYSLTAAIRSRSMLFELNPITNEVLRDQLTLIEEKEGLTVDEDAAKYLITSSAGDMRAMLKLLEFAVVINTHVTLKTLRSLRPNALQGGSSEDTNHYHLISAMIKSIRGSDPDAAIYYIARMIEGGESADFIARRLVILASEDIGNANPNALVLANSALQTVLQIGFPEARIILAQTAIYLSASPKSNSAYKAINEAQKSVKKGNILPVPPHIQDPPQNYLYPHDFGGWVEQNYLASDDQFVQMKPIGFEKRLIEWLEKIKQIS